MIRKRCTNKQKKKTEKEKEEEKEKGIKTTKYRPNLTQNNIVLKSM